MSELDLLTDEIFGCDDATNESQACLEMIRDLLAPLNVVNLAILDDSHRVRSSWSAQGEQSSGLDADLLAAVDQDAEEAWNVDCDRLEFAAKLGGHGLSQGVLFAEFDCGDDPNRVLEPLRTQLRWLRTAGTAVLTVGDQCDEVMRSQARMKQMEQQHRAFQEEHLRIVEMNLKYSDGRMREQQRYASQLEAQVNERTRDLMASEAEIRAILDTAPDGIITFDRDGVIQSCNRVANSMFGYSHAHVVGLHVSALLGESVQWILAEGGFDADEASHVKCVDHEFVARRLDGTTFPMHFAVSSVNIESGRLYTVIMRDVTEQKETEKLIRSQKDRLAAINKAKSEFLANMSHEIRTPMTAILGFAEVLRESNARPDQIEVINTISRNGTILLEIINDILDLSKIESGKIEVESIPVQPVAIVSDVTSLMSVRATAKKLELKVDYRGPVPASISTDPTRLRQILVNLVGNAIKFTESGSVTIAVELKNGADHNPALQFEVIDTGIGIDAEHIEKLFQPFAQADSSMTRRFGGTGLGLAICHRLAEMLGGEIGVESELGAGSTFRFNIATGDLDGVELLANPQQSPAPAPADAPTTTDTTCIDCRVLVAEDGADNQRLIKFILKKAGMDVTVVDNGALALQAALEARDAGEPFDVILMDMQMPVMDGYTATAKLREANYDRPIIALTAHAMKTDRDKCLDAGCDEYTTKPIKRDVLLNLIHTFCEPVPPDHA